MLIFALISRLFAILHTRFCLYLVQCSGENSFVRKNKHTHPVCVTRGNLPSKAEIQTIIWPSLKTSNTFNDKPNLFPLPFLLVLYINLYTQRLYFKTTITCAARFLGYSWMNKLKVFSSTFTIYPMDKFRVYDRHFDTNVYWVIAIHLIKGLNSIILE